MKTESELRYIADYVQVVSRYLLVEEHRAFADGLYGQAHILSGMAHLLGQQHNRLYRLAEKLCPKTEPEEMEDPADE